MRTTRPARRRRRAGRGRRRESRAVASKNAEIVQRKKAERAFENERQAKRRGDHVRETRPRRARSSREAISLLGRRPGAEPAARAAERLDGIHVRARGHLARRLDATLAPARCCRAGAGRSMRSRRARVERLRPPSCRAGTARSTQFGRARTGRSCSSAARTARRGSSSSRPAGWLARLRPGAPLRDAVFSPDGKSVITGDANGVIIGGTPAAAPGSPGPSTAPRSASSRCRPTAGSWPRRRGRRPASGCAADGSHVARLPHPVSVEGVSFDSSGAQLLTLARDARIFDTRDGGRRRSCSTSRGRSSRRSSRRPGDSSRPAAATTWP